MRCTFRSKAKSHVSAEATQRGTSRCLLLLRVPSNRQRTSTGRITLSTRFATRFSFSSDLYCRDWKWATRGNFRYWQRHWTTSATNIDRQVLVVASTKTQPKGQRVDPLHFVSANDRRSISTKSYPFGRDLNFCSWRTPFRSFRRLSRREWPTWFLAWLETRVFRERNLSKYRASFFRSIGLA